MARRLSITLLLTALCLYVRGQHSLQKFWEQGLPHITRYSPQEYKADLQNWSIVQDTNGIIYVGNTSGILEYDGTRWRLIKTPGGKPIKSLTKDSKGRIYAGSVGDLGYLEPDMTGEMKFRSLLNNLDSASRKFKDVWNIYSVHDSIYFISGTHILRWANNTFQVWRGLKTGYSEVIRDQLYVDIKGRGLTKFSGDSIVLVSGSESLFKKEKIEAFLPYKDKGVLAFSENGIYASDSPHAAFKAIDNELKVKVYATARLQNGDYVLGTTGSGLYVIDGNGTIKKHYTKNHGLSSNVVHGTYVDGEGDVWLATNIGITRIELDSPLRLFNESHGIGEDISDITYFNGRLYVATPSSFLQLSEEGSDIISEALFEKIKDDRTYNCKLVDGELIITTVNKTYTLDKNDHLELLYTDNDYIAVTEYPTRDSVHLLFGTLDSYIGELLKVNNKWRVGKTKIKIEGRPYRISQVDNGDIFISTRYNGVYQIAWTESKKVHSLLDNYSLIHYDTLCGLPTLTVGDLSLIKNSIYVSLGDLGLYKYDSVNQIFKRDSTVLNSIPYKDYQVGLAEPAPNGFWLPVYKNYETLLFKYENEKLKEINIGGRFSNLIIEKIFDANDEIVFMGSDNGIIMYNQHKPFDGNSVFKIRIRKVLVKGDSAIYAGHSNTESSRSYSIEYASNNLLFQFALPSYDLSSKNQYQYFLEGFSEDWSAWSHETQANFTNLTEGNYFFHVRGKNIYGHVSEEDLIKFDILPPWYRTWWAYGFYGLVSIGFVILIVHLRLRKLQKEKAVLENTVKERTEEITQQAEQLTEQTEKLKEMDRIKSRFFVNISHEFRTPLTLIKGPIEKFLEHPEQSLPLDNAQMIRRNADRLLQLVNQLLDLSKLDVGNLKPELRVGDINKFLGVIASSFKSLALQYNQVYTLKMLEAPLFTSFDHDKLEKIVYNLLSNAFKFTHEGGKIEFSVSYEKPQLKIEVTDSGMGIDKKHLPYIFDRLYQVDENDTGREGTGIGLSLVKELVSVLEGTVSVRSAYGQGTEFTVNLPVVESDAIQEEGIASEEHQKIVHEMEGLVPNEILTEEGEEEKEHETILLAEDNADLRNYIGEQLSGEYHILVASTGKQALAITFQEIPDLIITDIMMPEMDGLSFCKEIKSDERTNHIPVIVLTAKVGSESKLTGLETGADDYLTKPFDRHELLARVKNLITLRRLLRGKYRQQLTLGTRDVVIDSVDEKFLKRVEVAIENNLSLATFGVPELQEQLAMSKTQFHRKMKALTDQAPGEFLRNYRLRRAAQLLAKHAGSVKEIAFAVGFANISYFTRSFKELFGKSPSEYSQPEGNVKP